MVAPLKQFKQRSSAPARAGKHTLYLYTCVPQRPDLSSPAIADRIEERIDAKVCR